MVIISSKKEKTQFSYGINTKQSLEAASASGGLGVHRGLWGVCESLIISLEILRDGASHDAVPLFKVGRQA